ncbi:hypothetical protein [Halococcus saccharolyticus]|uniref:Uncharacterized protein n=1 Tax=Halococcus saccharolyticus DSM 5350 TaxID=1227455 RepID=M0MBL3_9EURY|nr:hypothetical protein [Halococcus saccharolyticus]EMA43136.1 hypothetical protein C449_14197 [Halococcus saccharolyticus DSM 5350]
MTRSSQHDDTDGPVVEFVRERRPTVADADLVLLVLPTLLVVGWAAGVVSSASLPAALAVAMVPALATLGYALFYDPPSGAYAN